MKLLRTSLWSVMASTVNHQQDLRATRPVAGSWLIAFTEAGMVGARADCVRRVALFRHPLEPPYSKRPRLSLTNKERIEMRSAHFIEENFLARMCWSGKWLRRSHGLCKPLDRAGRNAMRPGSPDRPLQSPAVSRSWRRGTVHTANCNDDDGAC